MWRKRRHGPAPSLLVEQAGQLELLLARPSSVGLQGHASSEQPVEVAVDLVFQVVPGPISGERAPLGDGLKDGVGDLG